MKTNFLTNYKDTYSRYLNRDLCDDDVTISLKFSNIDFSNYEFIDLYLDYTKFLDCNLGHSEFVTTSLVRASFVGSSLDNTVFRVCNLLAANFKGVDLTNTSFYNCIGNGREVKSLHLSSYSIVYTAFHIFIGCSKFEITEFKNKEIDIGWWHSDEIALLNTNYEHILYVLEHSPAF